MRSRFFTYSVIVALICSLGCWTALVQRATGGPWLGKFLAFVGGRSRLQRRRLGDRRWWGAQMNSAAPRGSHLLADLFGVAADLLRDQIALDVLLRGAAIGAGARVLGSHFHSFGADEGVTGVVLLAESHLSIHTWPESGFAAVDIFMCGAADPGVALEILVGALEPARRRIETVNRGLDSR